MMAEVASKFEAGVEAMRQVAIDRVNAWHRGKWQEEIPLLEEEVHELLIAIIGDIRVAEVQGEQNRAPEFTLLKVLHNVWFAYHQSQEEHRLNAARALNYADGNFKNTVVPDDCPDPICIAVREALKEQGTGDR